MSRTAVSSSLEALERGNGVLRLAPAWVPRAFCVPGRRIKLHPDDYYALGAIRGGIDERWLSSTVRADNGPLTGSLEGLSQVVVDDAVALTFAEAVSELGAALLGEKMWGAHGGWPMYSKFFDNFGPLPFHVHHRDEHAALTGKLGKPEAYYFPPQLNNHGGSFPHTFFGLQPSVTRDDVRERLARFNDGDNRITELSTAHRLTPGTGWDVPAGVLHAPGSLCTYEPQRASDVFAMYESVNDGRAVPDELLWKDVPAERRGDLDFLIEILDWTLNVDPDFAAHRFMRPRLRDDRPDGCSEASVVYLSDAFSASELTVLPSSTVTVVDPAPYGLICVQGHGTFGGLPISSPALIRFGELTHDEYFVSKGAARRGVTITNASASDPLVILKHFGPA